MPSTVNIKGIETKYDRTCSTPTPAKTLIFLHGWSGTSESWKPNISDLSHKYDCIAINMPGFGVSSEPNHVWNVQEYAEFVRDFAKQLGIQEFVLVGKSFGGRVAIYYASKWVETLSSLVLVSSAGIEQKSLLTKIRVLIARLGKALLAPFGRKPEEYIRNIFYKSTGVEKDRSEYKWNVKKAVTNTDLSESASEITIPTLIIWGTEDKILPFKWGRELNKLIAGSKLIQIPGGHNAHAESAKAFNNALENFLSEN